MSRDPKTKTTEHNSDSVTYLEVAPSTCTSSMSSMGSSGGGHRGPEMKRFLGHPEPGGPEPTQDPPTRVDLVIIDLKGRRTFPKRRTSMSTLDSCWLHDEPPAVGGRDSPTCPLSCHVCQRLPTRGILHFNDHLSRSLGSGCTRLYGQQSFSGCDVPDVELWVTWDYKPHLHGGAFFTPAGVG